ncbi:hypothetical protein [Marinifilum caeruleilacunae]|uniref:Uncharacterized protein n=1 Tax=Marinifilum caeruleilacunae TaxID=2499076 RepID=A0ABX1WUD7_9BACT|nr:hypothetical protein [Marinifilum caeruleilacunae]NOU59709.1 hypothetical protein [Marinifilum caeruleilacunae]
MNKSLENIQIGLTISPCGIHKLNRLNFAVIIGLDILPQKELIVTPEVISEIREFIITNFSDSNFSVELHSQNQKTITLDFLVDDIDQILQPTNWASILGYEKRSAEFEKNDADEAYVKLRAFSESRTGRKIENRAFLYENTNNVPNDDEKSNRFSTIAKNIEIVDNRLERVSGFAEKYKNEVIDKSFSPQYIDFHDLQASIYQNSALAMHYFGMVININCPIPKEDGSYKLVFKLQKKELAGYFKRELYTDHLSEEFDKDQFILSLKTDYVFKRKNVPNEKFYHGRSNFGLITLPESRGNDSLFEFKSFSEIQNWNAQLATNNRDSLARGLILYHKLDKKAFDKTFVRQEIQGHNIVCTKTIRPDEFEEAVFTESLCKRKLQFMKKGKILSIDYLKQHEEGCINFNNETLISPNNALLTNELFRFEGYNLVLPKPTNGSSNDGKQVIATDKKYIDDWMKKNGIVTNYSYPDESTISLTCKYDELYQFHFRFIESVTNYVIPIKSSNETELTLIDVINSGFKTNVPCYKAEKFEHEDSLINWPIEPPHIIPNIKSKSKIKSNIFTLKNKDKQGLQSFIYPPSTSIHFAQLIGVLDPLFFKNYTSVRDEMPSKKKYLLYTEKFVENSMGKIPSVHVSNKHISYIPDLRILNMVIYPSDWYTKQLLKRKKHSTKIYIPLWNYFFDNNPHPKALIQYKDPFRNFVPRKIELIYDENKDVSKIKIEYLTGPSMIQHKEIPLPYPGIYHFSFAFNYDTEYKKENHKNFKFHPAEFTFEDARIQPKKPNILTEHIILEQFDSLDLKSFIFFEFKTNQDPVRKNLSLICESTQLLDESKSLPGFKVENKRLFLIDEYAPDNFNTTIKIDDNLAVYPNRFGVEIELNLADNYVSPRGELYISISPSSRVIYSFKRNESLGNAIVYLEQINDGKKTVHRLHIGQQRSRVNSSFRIIFNYFKDLEKDKLQLEILIRFNRNEYSYKNLNNLDLIDLVGLPSNDFDHTCIFLDKDLESLVLKKISDFSFNYYSKKDSSYIVNPDVMDYFVYKDEKVSKFKKMIYRLKATSRFREHFAEIEDDNSFESLSDQFELVIKNNSKPPTPKLEVTPYFHMSFKLDKKKQTIVKTRNYQLMIEIERPWSEDQFAIVVSKNIQDEPDKLIFDNETSAIGHDIIKLNGSNLPKSSNIKQFIQTRNFISDEDAGGYNLYLTKYFGDEQFGDHPEPTLKRVKIGMYEYELLVLTPYFSKEKNKWIVILGFDELQNFIDPFVKLVTTRFQEVSVKEDLKVSTFTKPIILPIHSKRSITLVREKKMVHLKIKINSELYRIDCSNLRNNNSFFMLCYLKKGSTSRFRENELLEIGKNGGDIRVLGNRFILLKGSSKNIPLPLTSKKYSVLIFEIENHANLDHTLFEPSGKSEYVNYLNHPSMKISYMEEIEIPN